ncbi:MAG TPA: hypothetical protein VHR42_01495, partial [Clostridia bacterium]|nr:hypothetical protein [Clostridia bacterium]
MVKGMTRRIVEIKETGSGYFEKAIFFVKSDGNSAAEQTLTEEAMRIIDNLCSDLKIKSTQRKTKFITEFIKITLAAIAGAAAGAFFF